LVVIDSPYWASSGRTASMIAALRSSGGKADARFPGGFVSVAGIPAP
jgi:hypothetical protein